MSHTINNFCYFFNDLERIVFMKSCLIVTDYQYDFAAPDGILTAGKPAAEIEENIYKKVENYIKNNDSVVFSIDTHYPDTWSNHPESKAFKLHCQKGTKGWRLYGKLAKYMDCNIDNVKIIEKSAYCFDFKEVEKIVDNFDKIEIVGLVTDICVFNIAIVFYTAKVNDNKNVDIVID